MDIDFHESAACDGIEENFSALSLNGQRGSLPLLNEAIENINSGLVQRQFAGIQSIRKMLSSERPPINEVIQSAVCPILISNFSCYEKEFAFEICWILCNIASGDSSNTEYLLNLNVLEYFYRIFDLDQNSYNLQDQIIWALGNIAGDSAKCRDFVLSSAIMEKVYNHINRLAGSGEKAYKNIVWMLSNLARGKPHPPSQYFIILERYFKEFIIIFTDQEILSDACWGMYYTTECLPSLDHFEDNLLKKITFLLSYEDRVVIPALRVLGNYISGTQCWSKIKSLDVVPMLLNLLKAKKTIIRKEAAWVLSNLCAESIHVVEHLINENAYLTIAQCLKDEKDLNAVGEIVWVISNSLDKGGKVYGKYFFENGWISSLIDIFTMVKADKTKMVIIEGLESAFKSNPELITQEYLEKLKRLNESPNLQQALKEKLIELIDNVMN